MAFDAAGRECSVVALVGGDARPALRVLSISLTSTALMNRLFNKKPKKPLDPSHSHVSLGIPTNIAIGPLGFRAELDLSPNGEWG